MCGGREFYLQQNHTLGAFRPIDLGKVSGQHTASFVGGAPPPPVPTIPTEQTRGFYEGSCTDQARR